MPQQQSNDQQQQYDETFQQQQQQQQQDSQQNDGQRDVDEGVLRDVLDQLDHERRKRAELEDKVRECQQQQQQQAAEAAAAVELAHVPRKEMIALETELSGYRDLINILTQERPAIAAALREEEESKFLQQNARSASGKQSKTLSLEAVRLLEIMPWDENVQQQYAFGTEHVYEWQIYDKKRKCWTNHLRYFSSLFKSLPVLKPQPNMNAIASKHSKEDFASTSRMGMPNLVPSKHCVLTNQALTQLYDIADGFPLPKNGGTWEWVAGWRVQKKQLENSDDKKSDCDNEGWSYAVEPTHFLLDPAEFCWDNAGSANESNSSNGVDGNSTATVAAASTKSSDVPIRTVRRRKWTRKRVLVDYPYASEQTKHFLRLLAENANLQNITNKITDQLVETKTALTETEATLLQTREDFESKIEDLKLELVTKETMLESLTTEMDRLNNSANGSASNSTTKARDSSGTRNANGENNNNVKHQVRNLLSQFVTPAQAPMSSSSELPTTASLKSPSSSSTDTIAHGHKIVVEDSSSTTSTASTASDDDGEEVGEGEEPPAPSPQPDEINLERSNKTSSSVNDNEVISNNIEKGNDTNMLGNLAQSNDNFNNIVKGINISAARDNIISTKNNIIDIISNNNNNNGIESNGIDNNKFDWKKIGSNAIRKITTNQAVVANTDKIIQNLLTPTKMENMASNETTAERQQ